MQVQLLIDFRPERVLPWFNTMAAHNADLFLEKPGLPLLYDSGVVYAQEKLERFSDYVEMLKSGHEDCDSLAPARAGELIARGWRAMRDGDAGYALAEETRPRTIKALCFISTSSREDDPAPLFHVEVEYWIDGRRFTDDPSERLGMNGQYDPFVVARWRRAGVTPGQRITIAGLVPVVSLGRRFQ